jgi:D-alanyl-D-alanine carboxypeptidase
MHRLKVAAVIALSVAALGAVGASAGGREAHRGRALDHALTRLVHMRGGPPGAAAGVQRGHRLAFHGAGVRNARSHRRWHRTDHMRIASVAKAFSGAVALALVDRGRLRLGDTIGELLPRLPSAWAAVTLRQALNHTSGLPEYLDSEAFRHSFQTHPRRYLSPSDVIDFVRDKDLEFTPGSRYEYSNTDNFVIAMMARAVTHRSYRGLLRSIVFGPLRLDRTSLPRGFRLPRPLAHGYFVDPPHPPTDVSTAFSASGAWASGGIQSTPADLNRFTRGYLGRRLFGRATQRRQLRFVKGHSEPPGPGANRAGLGIFRYRTRCGTVFGHTGNFPGYTQFTAATRSGARSVTVSVNAQVVPDSPRRSDRRAFAALHRIYTLAVCAALPQHG